MSKPKMVLILSSETESSSDTNFIESNHHLFSKLYIVNLGPAKKTEFHNRNKGKIFAIDIPLMNDPNGRSHLELSASTNFGQSILEVLQYRLPKIDKSFIFLFNTFFFNSVAIAIRKNTDGIVCLLINKFIWEHDPKNPIFKSKITALNKLSLDTNKHKSILYESAEHDLLRHAHFTITNQHGIKRALELLYNSPVIKINYPAHEKNHTIGKSPKENLQLFYSNSIMDKCSYITFDLRNTPFEDIISLFKLCNYILSENSYHKIILIGILQTSLLSNIQFQYHSRLIFTGNVDTILFTEIALSSIIVFNLSEGRLTDVFYENYDPNIKTEIILKHGAVLKTDAFLHCNYLPRYFSRFNDQKKLRYLKNLFSNISKSTDYATSYINYSNETIYNNTLNSGVELSSFLKEIKDSYII